MADSQQAPVSTFPAAANFNTMTDLQLRQTISQLSAYASPTPAKAYLKNIHTWSSAASTPAPKTPQPGGRATRTRATRSSNLASATPTTTQTQYIQPIYQPPIAIPLVPPAPPNPPKPPLPTAPQAVHSTYASRLRTGATLLMQPILASSSTTGARSSTRRGTVINYADPGSGDELPDAGAIDSDDSDFMASGGTRTTIRQARGRSGPGMSTFSAATGVSSTSYQPALPKSQKAELDQSYLGAIPPSKFFRIRQMQPTAHVYPSQDLMEQHASKRSSLIPIRVEFETDTHRVRDCFVWNIHESLIKPETFARTFCNDLELPQSWVETVANQIRAQIEDHEGVASMELGQDGAVDDAALPLNGEDLPECRVILSIDVQIANHHLLDHIEWDLFSPLTPEAFSQRLCMEIGLGGEAIPLVAHAVHEELLKHKKDAIEWGVIESGSSDAGATLKDKTGLGFAWGRAPKDGRGPKTLKSVWRDWAEAEEFRTKFDVLSAEEVEKREIERERASRRLRRETSKFQTTRSNRRIRY